MDTHLKGNGPRPWDYYCASRLAIAERIAGRESCNEREQDGFGSHGAKEVEDCVESSLDTRIMHEALQTNEQAGNDCGSSSWQPSKEPLDQQNSRKSGNRVDGASHGRLAEAFADELDLLREDEHFKGTPRDVAVISDMIRCVHRLDFCSTVLSDGALFCWISD